MFAALATVETPNQIITAIGEALSASFAGHPDPLSVQGKRERARKRYEKAMKLFEVSLAKFQ